MSETVALYDSASDLSLQRILKQWSEHRPAAIFCEVPAAGETHTYAELEQSVSWVANGLRHHCGVRKGDRVVILMETSFRYFVAMFAIQRIGGVCVPSSLIYTAEEISYVLNDSGATHIFVDASARQLAADALGGKSTVSVIASGMTLGASASFDDLLREGPDEDVISTGADDLATIIYTSGTTAAPRGVTFSHGNLIYAATNMARSFQWQRDERVLFYSPLSNSNGAVMQLGPALLHASTLVIVPKFSASQFGSQLSSYDITFAALQAPHVKMILNHPRGQNDSNHPCSRMLLGLTLDAPRRKEFESRFGTHLVSTYGLTETLGPPVVGGAVSDLFDSGACGRVIPGYQIGIVRDEGGGDEAGPVIGDIVVRCASKYGLCGGYWNNAEGTRELFEGGWLHTGDRGYFDGQGQLHFVDRSKDVIKRAGWNISPAEIEAVLVSCAGVEDAAVVSIPDDMRDEAIVAVVVPSAGLTVSDLQHYCESKLASYKCPQHILTIDRLPRDDVLGKVDRKRLRILSERFVIAGDGGASEERDLTLGI